MYYEHAFFRKITYFVHASHYLFFSQVLSNFHIQKYSPEHYVTSIQHSLNQSTRLHTSSFLHANFYLHTLQLETVFTWMLKQVSKDICVYSYLMLYPNTGGVYVYIVLHTKNLYLKKKRN